MWQVCDAPLWTFCSGAPHAYCGAPCTAVEERCPWVSRNSCWRALIYCHKYYWRILPSVKKWGLHLCCITMYSYFFEEPPKLPKGVFTDAFCAFVESCLKKNPKDRSDLYSLMDSDFIKNVELTRYEFAKWICDTMDLELPSPESFNKWSFLCCCVSLYPLVYQRVCFCPHIILQFGYILLSFTFFVTVCWNDVLYHVHLYSLDVRHCSDDRTGPSRK